jgi:23S rRNA (guanine745-N1)-methyltransferase
MKVVLRCPVRGCPRRLAHEGPRWICSGGHSFDQHRTGFLNLLQPQDRRSRNPGDSREAALARRRLAGSGHADSVHRTLANVIASSVPGKSPSLLDVGCGEGAFLRYLASIARLERHGVDISGPSIEFAAKASPEVLFVVANADRFIPYAGDSFDFVTSIDARANAAEFVRILKPRGLVLIAVPGPDDLLELRERIHGARVEKSRASRVEEEFARTLALVDRTTVRENRTFDLPILLDLLRVTYRGFRQSERAAVESLTAMNVTLSHEVLAFRRP